MRLSILITAIALMGGCSMTLTVTVDQTVSTLPVFDVLEVDRINLLTVVDCTDIECTSDEDSLARSPCFQSCDQSTGRCEHLSDADRCMWVAVNGPFENGGRSAKLPMPLVYGDGTKNQPSIIALESIDARALHTGSYLVTVSFSEAREFWGTLGTGSARFDVP